MCTYFERHVVRVDLVSKSDPSRKKGDQGGLAMMLIVLADSCLKCSMS